jgi:hypothetical protein
MATTMVPITEFDKSAIIQAANALNARSRARCDEAQHAPDPQDDEWVDALLNIVGRFNRRSA